MVNNKRDSLYQAGFSVVELMVAMIIGLLTTLVIMQVFSAFEGQKRSTSGSADAQTNGSIAMMMIQRSVQKAGYGLPLPNTNMAQNVLRCNAFADFDIDGNAATDDTTNIFPLVIQNGVGANGSDSIRVRYSTNAMGATPVDIISAADPTGVGIQVQSNIGCNIDNNTENDDIALIQNINTCDMVTIDNAVSAGATHRLILDRLPASNAVLVNGATIACMGNWRDYVFTVANNELQQDGQPIVSEVVSLQAQYGVSAAAGNNIVNEWVDADGIWLNPGLNMRNRIKAIRVAVVLRNGLRERDNVTPTPPVIWTDNSANTTPIDVSGLPNWQQYRYRTFSTVIPLRNIMWSRGAVQ